MKRLHLLFATIFLAALPAVAQTGSIVGTWVLVKADKILPGGKEVEDFGAKPHGLVIFTQDGHYAVEIYRAEHAKFSSDDKLKVAAEEFKTAALGMSVHFGRYMVDPEKKTISFHIDRASFANWDDTTQVRMYEMKGDELSWRVPVRPDGTIPVTVLRRAGGCAPTMPAMSGHPTSMQPAGRH